jgi:hypothetical protein
VDESPQREAKKMTATPQKLRNGESSQPKYRLTGEMTKRGHTLHRVQYLRDIDLHGITAGDLGGWIESEENLSHSGSACVCGSARVTGSARISGDACITDNARVTDDARVSGDYWGVSPLQIRGTAHQLTTCSRVELAIGCEKHPVAWWREHHRGVGRKYGYSAAQIVEYRQYIELAAAWLVAAPWGNEEEEEED